MESLGGLLLIFSLGFDALDGAAARLSGSESKFGAFLDSTLDRWAESAIYFALLVRAWQRNDQLFALLIFIAFAGSVMVSYTRARAEGIGVQCTEGWLTRLERLILIIVGLVLTAWSYIPLTILVGVIAVLANITAIQRIMLVYHATRKED
jgi:CDP-diacylglycerol--glycerol-3-phosphate 3-phosphatidyltransferase